MKKLVIFVLSALSMFAANPNTTTTRADVPLPICDGCFAAMPKADIPIPICEGC